MENLALYVEKEEKVWMELIVSSLVLERISQYLRNSQILMVQVQIFENYL